MLKMIEKNKFFHFIYLVDIIYIYFLLNINLLFKTRTAYCLNRLINCSIKIRTFFLSLNKNPEKWLFGLDQIRERLP